MSFAYFVGGVKPHLVIPAAALALLAAGACGARASGKGLLPPPNPAAIVPAPYQPERGFDTQGQRAVFRADDAGPYRAEIFDLLIAPGKTTTVKREGVVVVETRQGAGTATVQDKRVPLAPGTTFGLSQSGTATVENSGKEPLLLRVYVITMR
jgi:hypothetical protein